MFPLTLPTMRSASRWKISPAAFASIGSPTVVPVVVDTGLGKATQPGLSEGTYQLREVPRSQLHEDSCQR